MDNKKKFDDFLDESKSIIDLNQRVEDLENTFPELKEREDEQHRKWILEYLYDGLRKSNEQFKDQFMCAIVWLEKQCGITKLSEEEQNKFAKGVLTRCALSFIDYLDTHKYEGKMCVSNGECEDIENAFHNAMWDRLHRYYCKYIENQSEQKSVDTVKSKFKIGDWIVCEVTGSVYQIKNCIENLSNHKYGYDLTNGDYIGSDEVNHYHLWTIADAKDGDVLLFEGYYNSIVLFQGIGINGEGRINYHCKCDLDNYSFGIQENVACLGTIEKNAEQYHPATKEQCDLLFAKMQEACYKWDAEKKELKKINNALEECEIEHIEHGKYYYCIKDYYSGGCKRTSKGEVVQALRGMSMMALGVKPNEYFIPVKCIVDVRHVWSKEDEYLLNETKQHLEELIRIDKANHCGCDVQFYQRDIDWLKSIKQRIEE